jgi:hypothetical protein
MAERFLGAHSSPGGEGSARHSERKKWSAPRMRALKTGAAENGPTFPTADGIEGQS